MPAREIERLWQEIEAGAPADLRPKVIELRDLLGASTAYSAMVEAMRAEKAEDTRHRHEMERLSATHAHDLRIKGIVLLGGGAGLGGLLSELARYLGWAQR